MNEMQIFRSPDFGEVRTVEENGTVLFCGSDIAKALGYTNTSKAINDHCKGITKRYTPTAGGEQELSFITEGDIYRLAARSKLPGADAFERWIFDEVIPSVRKNGGYLMGQDTMSADELMARALMVAQKTLADREARISALTVQNAILAPKAEYFDELVERNTLTNFRETAKELGIAPKKFVQFLLDRKYIYRDQKGKLLPYESKNDGLFEVKETYNEKTKWSGTQTLVTPKGRETFRLLCPAA
mgnify:CR=1 FL=1